MEKLANIATILGFVIYVLITLTDKWPTITKIGGSSMLSNIALGALVIGIIFAAISFYYSRKKPRGFYKSVKVIHRPEGHQYLVEGNICYHIPNEPTFNYLGSFFGFDWVDSREMLPDEIKRKYTIGKQLPSILAHCPKQDK